MKDQSKYFEKVENYFEASPPMPENHDSIGFIPPAKTVTYVHRGKIEEEILTFLQTGGTGATVGLHAPGGLGKTELAKQTVQALLKEYEILWIDVGEKKPLQIIGEILTKYGLQTQPTDTYENLLNELQHAYQTHRFLIVLDDIRHATLDSLQDILPPKPCTALVTSRIQQIGGVKTFALDKLNSGNIQDAEKQLYEVIALRDLVNDVYSEGADYGNFSIALLNMGEKEKAKTYAIKAKHVFEKIGEEGILKQVNELIAACE